MNMCPVCERTIADTMTVCPLCVGEWQQHLLTIASMWHELDLLATKLASLNARMNGHVRQATAPSPVRLPILHLEQELRQYAFQTLMLTGRRPRRTFKTHNLLRQCAHIRDMSSLVHASQFIESGERLYRKWRRVMSRPEERVDYGACTEQVDEKPDGTPIVCEGRITAVRGSQSAECSACHALYEVNELRAYRHGLVMAATYDGSSQELSNYLREQGYRVSAATLRRWAHDGKISVQRLGERHYRYRIGDILTVLDDTQPRRLDKSRCER